MPFAIILAEPVFLLTHLVPLPVKAGQDAGQLMMGCHFPFHHQLGGQVIPRQLRDLYVAIADPDIFLLDQTFVEEGAEHALQAGLIGVSQFKFHNASVFC